MHATLKNNLTKLNPKISEVCQTTVKKTVPISSRNSCANCPTSNPNTLYFHLL